MGEMLYARALNSVSGLKSHDTPNGTTYFFQIPESQGLSIKILKSNILTHFSVSILTTSH